MKEGYCKNCGQYFRRNRGSRDASLFCSRECACKYRTKQAQERRKQKEAAKVRFVTCPICGAEFYTKRRYVRYCSKECCLEAGRTMARERVRLRFKSKKVKCRWCGKEFETKFKHSKVFCSDECRKAQQKENDRLSDHRRGNPRQKRLRGAVVDKDISLDKLITRDKGKCRICGGRVDKKDYAIIRGRIKCGPLYPTIDHIVPLSLGGLHSWANVQLAHFLCNSIKGGDFLVREDIKIG